MSDISDIESWIDSDEEDIDDLEEEQDDDSEYEYDILDENSNICLHNTFITLTKYEKTKILGLRARQIELGAKPQIRYTKSETPIEIAERELKLKKLPFKIKRKLPSGEFEIIELKNL